MVWHRKTGGETQRLSLTGKMRMDLEKRRLARICGFFHVKDPDPSVIIAMVIFIGLVKIGAIIVFLMR
ncbi:UNVERIFIED_CONTAM: hypothetical protein FKN15_017648 [Acipenser sinensis]